MKSTRDLGKSQTINMVSNVSFQPEADKIYLICVFSVSLILVATLYNHLELTKTKLRMFLRYIVYFKSGRITWLLWAPCGAI